MAAANSLTHKKFKVLIGNGATPEVFAAPCAFNTRGWSGNADTIDSTVPDCDDEELAVWTETEVSALSSQIQGNGVLHMADWPTWRQWFFSGAKKNVRVLLDRDGANKGGYMEQQYVLTNLELTSERLGKAQVSVTMKSSGSPTWTDAA